MLLHICLNESDAKQCGFYSLGLVVLQVLRVEQSVSSSIC